MLEKIFNYFGYVKAEELLYGLHKTHTLERKLSELKNKNDTLQKELSKLAKEAEELKTQIIYRDEVIKAKEEQIKEKKKELDECKDQLEKALSKPLKHAHEIRHKNIKHRRKR